MADQNHAHAFEAPPLDLISMLLELKDDVLAEVLRGVKKPGVLAALASASSSLCRVIRSRLPLCLLVHDQQQADFITSAAERGVPFSSCTQLDIRAEHHEGCLAAAKVLRAAQQWPGLQQLRLSILRYTLQQQDELTLKSGLALLEEVLPQLQGSHLAMPAQLFSRARASPHLLQVTSLELAAYTAADTAAGTAAAAAAAPLNTSVLSAMKNLRALRLYEPPPVTPAAGVTGPFLLPHSLNILAIHSVGSHPNDPTACWLTHLPGCPQLQHLELLYAPRHHASAHPAAVVQAVSRYNRQLSSFKAMGYTQTHTWDAPVAGLSAAAGFAVAQEWRPDAALASLTGLESLAAGSMLHVRDQWDWQRLTHLSACTSLTGVQFHWAPDPQQAGGSLAVLQLQGCHVHLGGRDLCGLLLACPHLQRAEFDIGPPGAAAAVAAAAGPALTAHPCLHTLLLAGCANWGHAAAASAQFAELAPVLSGVLELTLGTWPCSRGRRGQSPLPTLSPCTALVSLAIVADVVGHKPTRDQFVSMLAPLEHLQCITAQNMLQVNASVMFPLMACLPQLRCVMLHGCGVRDATRVRRQLPPGLQLLVF